MPNWIAFDTDVQAAIFNELVDLHEIGVKTAEYSRLAAVIQGHTFWGGYIAPLFDRILEEAEIEP